MLNSRRRYRNPAFMWPLDKAPKVGLLSWVVGLLDGGDIHETCKYGERDKREFIYLSFFLVLSFFSWDVM
jgi:hypothetical protein